MCVNFPVYFQIKTGDKITHFIDARSESDSNWMRYVNCARDEDEQNLCAFQYNGNIYYKTFKAIPAGQELLIWYGEGYARYLNLSLGGKVLEGLSIKNKKSVLVEDNSIVKPVSKTT